MDRCKLLIKWPVAFRLIMSRSRHKSLRLVLIVPHWRCIPVAYCFDMAAVRLMGSLNRKKISPEISAKVRGFDILGRQPLSPRPTAMVHVDCGSNGQRVELGNPSYGLITPPISPRHALINPPSSPCHALIDPPAIISPPLFP